MYFHFSPRLMVHHEPKPYLSMQEVCYLFTHLAGPKIYTLQCRQGTLVMHVLVAQILSSSTLIKSYQKQVLFLGNETHRY